MNQLADSKGFTLAVGSRNRKSTIRKSGDLILKNRSRKAKCKSSSEESGPDSRLSRRGSSFSDEVPLVVKRAPLTNKNKKSCTSKAVKNEDEPTEEKPLWMSTLESKSLHKPKQSTVECQAEPSKSSISTTAIPDTIDKGVNVKPSVQSKCAQVIVNAKTKTTQAAPITVEAELQAVPILNTVEAQTAKFSVKSIQVQVHPSVKDRRVQVKPLVTEHEIQAKPITREISTQCELLLPTVKPNLVDIATQLFYARKLHFKLM